MSSASELRGANPVTSMSTASEPRRRRSSFQLLADAVGAPDARVAPDDTAARRRDAPDPTHGGKGNQAWRIHAVSGGGSLYREILQRTRDSYSTSPIEDENELKATGEEAPAPRRRLAIQFRRIQKQLLNRALAATVAGGGGAERVE